MKRIYIAGPYSADNVMDVLKNIREGNRIATEVFKLGYSPFSPWLDFMYVLMDFDNKLTIEDFYEYSIDWMEVSDAVLLTGDWQNSRGSVREWRFAIKNNIPIFYSIEDLQNSK